MRYLLFIPILIVFGLELVLFVKLISRYRKPWVPPLLLVTMFGLNLLLYTVLLYDPVPVTHSTVKPTQ